MALIAEAMKLMMNMKVSPGEGMWDIMKLSTVESLLQMAGSSLPEGFMESLNAKLIKIDKVKEI